MCFLIWVIWDCDLQEHAGGLRRPELFWRGGVPRPLAPQQPFGLQRLPFCVKAYGAGQGVLRVGSSIRGAHEPGGDGRGQRAAEGGAAAWESVGFSVRTSVCSSSVGQCL